LSFEFDYRVWSGR
jgi:hypothetical protein